MISMRLGLCKGHQNFLALPALNFVAGTLEDPFLTLSVANFKLQVFFLQRHSWCPMHFFRSNSAFAGSFKKVGSSTFANILSPPEPSPILSVGNQLFPMDSKLLKIIGEVVPPVDSTLDETAQRPKTPKMDDHLADQIDDQPPTEAVSLPAIEEKVWVRCVHPEGWIYFFKEHDDEPEDIQLHEICGDLNGEIVTHPAFNSQATNAIAHKPERLSKVDGEGPPVVLECGGLRVQTYVDNQRWYASKDKALLFPQQLTDELGQDYLV